MAQVRRNKTFKIGLTGNLGCGKTTVRKSLAKMGVQVLDTYELAFNLLSENPHRLSVRISEHLGADVLDSRGGLSRRKLEVILHTDPEKKAFFDETVGPHVREEIKRFLYSPIGSNIRAVESATVFETDSQHLYDEIWLVRLNPEVRLARLVAQDGVNPEQARLLIAEDCKAEEAKSKLSQRIIDNTGDVYKTEAQVREALDEIKNRLITKLL